MKILVANIEAYLYCSIIAIQCGSAVAILATQSRCQWATLNQHMFETYVKLVLITYPMYDYGDPSIGGDTIC